MPYVSSYFCRGIPSTAQFWAQLAIRRTCPRISAGGSPLLHNSGRNLRYAVRVLVFLQGDPLYCTILGATCPILVADALIPCVASVAIIVTACLVDPSPAFFWLDVQPPARVHCLTVISGPCSSSKCPACWDSQSFPKDMTANTTNTPLPMTCIAPAVWANL